MLRWWAGVLAVFALAMAVSSAQDRKNVWTGVYTVEQAKRGADVYQAGCATCHGVDLEGIELAPALAGGPFAQRWDGTALKKLFEQLQNMPPDAPEKRLSDQQYVDVLAFLLAANKIPAGTAPLVADKDALAQIAFLATKPKLDEP